jgi:hypothetical protein
MYLARVMHMAVDQSVLVGRLAAQCYRMGLDKERLKKDAVFGWDFEQAKVDVRRERKTLDIIYERRSWLLVEGVVTGDWVQCAAAHEAYSDIPKEDDWRQTTLLLQDFWCCSSKCVRIFRDREIDKLENQVSLPVQLTFKGGRKTMLRTTGRGLHGPQLARYSKG